MPPAGCRSCTFTEIGPPVAFALRPAPSLRDVDFGLSTTVNLLEFRRLGHQGAGSSGNMPAASFQVAELTVVTGPSAVSATVIATCSMETLQHSTGFGMPPNSADGMSA